VADQRIDEGRLTGTGWTGDAEEPRPAEVRAQRLHKAGETRDGALAFGRCFGNGAALAGAHPGNQCRGIRRHVNVDWLGIGTAGHD
jgi:hypothetical protein